MRGVSLALAVGLVGPSALPAAASPPTNHPTGSTTRLDQTTRPGAPTIAGAHVTVADGVDTSSGPTTGPPADRVLVKGTIAELHRTARRRASLRP